jgi:hypothetical protein
MILIVLSKLVFLATVALIGRTWLQFLIKDKASRRPKPFFQE